MGLTLRIMIWFLCRQASLVPAPVHVNGSNQQLIGWVREVAQTHLPHVVLQQQESSKEADAVEAGGTKVLDGGAEGAGAAHSTPLQLPEQQQQQQQQQQLREEKRQQQQQQEKLCGQGEGTASTVATGGGDGVHPLVRQIVAGALQRAAAGAVAAAAGDGAQGTAMSSDPMEVDEGESAAVAGAAAGDNGAVAGAVAAVAPAAGDDGQGTTVALDPMEVDEGKPAAVAGAATGGKGAVAGIGSGWFEKVQPPAVHAAVHEVVKDMEVEAAAAR